MVRQIPRYRVPRAVLGVLGVLGCASGAQPSTSPTLARFPNVPATWQMVARTQAVSAAHGMVVSGSPIASQVGADILKAGGNAMDAAVAVGFALAVVHPEAGNIGGGGFMVIRLADGTVKTIDYREPAPGKATANMIMDAEGNLTPASVTGHLASGVPGSVAGMTEVDRALGKLGLARVLQPAVALARD